MKLTNKDVIADLSVPEGKTEVLFWDDDLKGFGVRMHAGGKKTWIVQYRIGPQQRRLSLGDARKLD